MDYWREGLDNCVTELETAQQDLLDSELKDGKKNSSELVREHLNGCILKRDIFFSFGY